MLLSAGFGAELSPTPPNTWQKPGRCRRQRHRRFGGVVSGARCRPAAIRPRVDNLRGRR
jgi:hypothetical protein